MGMGDGMYFITDIKHNFYENLHKGDRFGPGIESTVSRHSLVHSQTRNHTFLSSSTIRV